ncbi:MAG: DUF4258 domain-containing protein [Chitinophagaceae bacterium]|nr:DUF4258 domain-containing protein [Chitinophagaceae bacterium]
MKSNRATFSLLVVLLFLTLFLLKRWNEPKQKELFDRSPAQLEYTMHALCKMKCRAITKENIEEIMDRGIINLNKSNRRDRPCPTFALQQRTDDGRNLRVIFAQCRTKTRVITCYDLNNDLDCECPTDKNSGDKNKNQYP